MKRMLCIILALIMCLSLLSCGEKPVQDETTPPVQDVTDDPVTDTQTETKEEEEPPVDPKTIWNGTLTHGGEGFYDPERDYSGEERFKVCAFTQGTSIFEEQIDAALNAWFTLANVEYDGIIHSKSRDVLSEVEQIAQEYDGVVLLYTYRPEAMDIARVLEENNCSFISFGELRDYSVDGLPLLCPTVHYTADYSAVVGGIAEYIGEKLNGVPEEDIGIIYGNESYLMPDLEPKFLDEVALQIPEYVDNCYLLDFYSGTIDYIHYEGFFENMLDEHPGVDYWIYVPLYTSYYNKYRDAEAEFARHPRLEGKTAIFSMNNPYDVWITDECKLFEKVYSCDFVFQMEPLAFGLCALMRGEATPETLWAEHIPEGEKYAIYPDDTCHEITRYNYKDYFKKVNEYTGQVVYEFDEEPVTDSSDTEYEFYEPKAPDYRYDYYANEYWPNAAPFRYEDVADKTVIATCDATKYAAPTYSSVTEMSKVSPVIVVGEIIDIRYVDSDPGAGGFNYAYTIYDMKISECIHGDYKADDIISVFEYGGYIRSGEYNRGVADFEFHDGVQPLKMEEDEVAFAYHHANAPTSEIGDRCVMFLHHFGGRASEHLWKNTGAWTGKFIIDDEGNVSRWSKDEQSFVVWGTLEELLEIARNTDFNESLYESNIRDIYTT